jgi:hypothetical protein
MMKAIQAQKECTHTRPCKLCTLSDEIRHREVFEKLQRVNDEQWIRVE